MTLKEKFTDKILSFLNDNMKERNAIECEKIADDFAIGFAEWYLNLYESDDADTFCKNTMIELLEIYKKEKGL
jgi:hypothetical protein